MTDVLRDRRSTELDPLWDHGAVDFLWGNKKDGVGREMSK